APGATFADGSHTVDLDGESYAGPALITELRKRSRRWNLTLDFNQVSPTYRTQTGYDPWNDQRNGFAWSQVNFYPDHGLVERVSPGVFADGRWNYAGERKWLRANLFTDVFLRWAQTHVGVHYRFGEEVWSGVAFQDVWNAGANLDITPIGALSVSAYADWGEGADLFTLARGDEFDGGLAVQFKPLDRLIIEPVVDHVRSTDHVTGELLFRQTVARARLRYQFDRRLSLRLVVQHNDSRSGIYQDLAAAGQAPWYHLSFGSKWEVDPLLTYRLNSFSVFYAGSTHDWRDFNAADPDAATRYRQTARQFFVKLQYLWQL
ncbi:MAG TPA: hypothetical protein PLQ13_09615, partial [Candidatus Krumholzibacteria bacterium]|nr:hypothetical protein [Candidatus Krumholzibacteria bacterium]